jgi:hypothetical protein
MPDTVIYRCSDSHLYTAPWRKALLLSVHLGAGRHWQRCPVDHRWRTANRVDVDDLTEDQITEARQNHF